MYRGLKVNMAGGRCDKFTLLRTGFRVSVLRPPARELPIGIRVRA